MRTVYMFRYDQDGDCMRSVLMVNANLYHVLELPWRGNLRNISCIPIGSYDVKFMKRSASGRYKDCYHIQNVTNRSGILIHQGNCSNDTHGCLLIGKKRGWLKGKRAILNSRTALAQFVRDLNKNDFRLKVVQWML